MHVNNFKLFFLLHNNAVVLSYSSVALPSLRKDIVFLAAVWFCAEYYFLVSFLSSVSSRFYKRWDCESLESVLCFSSIEKLKCCTSSTALGLIFPSIIVTTCIVEKIDWSCRSINALDKEIMSVSSCTNLCIKFQLLKNFVICFCSCFLFYSHRWNTYSSP